MLIGAIFSRKLKHKLIKILRKCSFSTSWAFSGSIQRSQRSHAI